MRPVVKLRLHRVARPAGAPLVLGLPGPSSRGRRPGYETFDESGEEVPS